MAKTPKYVLDKPRAVELAQEFDLNSLRQIADSAFWKSRFLESEGNGNAKAFRDLYIAASVICNLAKGA
jgi:hypothetical protein